MSHHRLVDSRTWTCFEILLIAVGLLAFVSGTIFLSNLSLAPWNPDHERNLAMAYATATAEVQAAQPDCGRQVMKPGDTCVYENCWKKTSLTVHLIIYCLQRAMRIGFHKLRRWLRLQ